LSQVHVAIRLDGRYDEHLFHLATDTAQQDFPTLPPRGEIRCAIPALPLQQGSYGFNLFCSVGGDIADWIQHAGTIDVEGSDFFGTGRLPPVQYGPFLVSHSWDSRKL
jgi:lipopolysaccharide transport system ATP-binding protein